MGEEQNDLPTAEDATGSAERIAQTPEVINLAKASDNIPGGPDAVKEMAQLLLEECSRLMQEICDGLAKPDATVVERAAHTLKSNADVFGANAVVMTALRIEKMGEAGNLDDAAREMGQLEKEVARLDEALKSAIESVWE